MKKLLSILLISVITIMAFFPAGVNAVEKYNSMPEIFKIDIVCDEREVDNNQIYVYKEYINTTNSNVNEKIKQTVDDMEAQLLPTMQKDEKKKANKNNRLDVNSVYYRTGNSFISTLNIATNTFYKQQEALVFSTKTYDLQTSEELKLSDIFAEDSAAWDILSKGIVEHFNSIYEGEYRQSDAIEDMAKVEKIKNADFTLSGMELTLHYYEKIVFPEKNNIAHVRFMYPEFAGMMTEKGMLATDNSAWKMVAITCDDGPKDDQSTYALNAFRKIGARVTYFIVGKQLDRFGYVLRKQYDQNQLFASHSFHHWSGYSIKTPERRLKELTMVDELTNKIVGEKSRYFRAPGGTYPPWIDSFLSVPLIQWSLDTFDYTGKSPRAILGSIKKGVQEYDIILCHDTGFQLHKAVSMIGGYLTENGFMMVNIDELIAAKGIEIKNNEVYWSLREGENSESHYNANKKMK